MHRACLDHVGVAVNTGQQELAVKGDRRRHERRRHGHAPAFVLHLARLRVEAADDALVAHQVHVVAVQDRRDDVTGASVVLPDDAVGAGDVARPAWPDRDDFLHRVARRQDNQPVADQRRVDGVAFDALAAPQFRPGFRVVADDELVAVGDELGSPRRRHDDGRGPAGFDGSRRPPRFLARLDVVGQQQRLLPLVLVALDDDEVLEQDRRGARAHPEQRKLADVGLPLEVAVDVVAVQALGPEVGHDHRAVGDHGRRGVAAAAVPVVEHGALVGGAFPQHGATCQVKRQHLHRVELVDAHAVGVHPRLAFHHVHGRLVVGWGRAPLDVRGQEDARTPDDGLRLPIARKGCLPRHIARGAPLGRHVLLV